MAYDSSKPAGADAIKDSDDEIRANFVHIKAAVDQEHVWDDTTASNTIHMEGSARITIDTYANIPAAAAEGRLFLATDQEKLYYDTGAAWVEVQLSGSHLLNSGDAMTGELSMGSNKITDLGTPSASADACTKSYADLIVGAGGAHAASHTDGTDDIQSSTDAQKGVMTSADHTLLSNLDATESRAKSVVGSYLDDDDPPETTTKNSQPALSFTTAVDTIIYFEPMLVPKGVTTATLKLRYAMTTSAADDVILKWTPVVNGSAGAEDSVTHTMDADTSEHSYAGSSYQVAALSEGDILGGKFYRDGNNASDTHGGNLLLILAWVEWS